MLLLSIIFKYTKELFNRRSHDVATSKKLSTQFAEARESYDGEHDMMTAPLRADPSIHERIIDSEWKEFDDTMHI